VAAIAFFIVASLMYALGWRIGEPGAGRRATMLVVTALSATAAALAAGWAIAWKLDRILHGLDRRPISDHEYQ
jgi:hypothetical protein